MNTLNQSLASEGLLPFDPNQSPSEQELDFLFAGDLAGGLRQILQLGIQATQQAEAVPA